MDTELVGDFERLGGGEDIFFQGAGEGADPAVFDVARYGLHRLEVTGRGDRKAHLHDIHPQPFQRQCDLQLLFDRQAGGQRLLAVPQGGIKYDDPIRHDDFLSCLFVHAPKGGIKNPCWRTGLCEICFADTQPRLTRARSHD